MGQLQSQETFTAALKMKWLIILQISEISSIMAEMSKESGFTLNFDMPQPLTPHKTELQRIMVNSQSDC